MASFERNRPQTQTMAESSSSPSPTTTKKRKRRGVETHQRLPHDDSRQSQGSRFTSATSSKSRAPTRHGRATGSDEGSASESEPDDELQDPEEYGRHDSLSGPSTWTYHLEIIQHPQRVRACGFGNKDRRPLSPPPIIRLWVRTSTGQMVDPALVETRFLILMVDLWSADRQQERNVVMHPVSAGVSRMDSPTMTGLALSESDLPHAAGGSSRPSTGTSRPMSGSSAVMSSISGGSWRQNMSSPSGTSQQTTRPYQSTEPSSNRLHRPSTADARLQPVSPALYAPSSSLGGEPPFAPRNASGSMSGAGAAYHQHRLLGHSTDPPRPSTAPSSHHLSSDSPRRGSYNLPPISELQEVNPSSSSRLTLPALQGNANATPRHESGGFLWGRPRTAQSTDTSLAATDYSFGRPSSSSSWQASTLATPDPGRDGRRLSTGWSDLRPWSSGMASHRPSSSSDSTLVRSPQSKWDTPYTVGDRDRERQLSDAYAPFHHTPDAPRYNFAGYMAADQYPRASTSWEAEQQQYPYQHPSTMGSMGVISGTGTGAAQYSRVLVGKVTAVCHKLQDENGRPGLFFFAADLGIRTEGTFTLRLALTDLAALMKPETVLGARAPILAETFTEPFTVFSAKRFPGVIPTTPLTKVFAAQGVKLSVRENRKGGGDAEAEAEAGGGDEDEE